MEQKPKGNPFLIVMLLTLGLFCMITSSGLVTALLVDISREFSTSVTLVGQLITVTSITWAIAAPLIGPLSDRFGRKRMVVWGLVLSGIPLVGYGLSHHFSAMVGLTVLVGLGGAFCGPNVLAGVGDYFLPANQGRIMSIVNIGQPLAQLAGIPVGAFIAGSYGWRWAFIALAAFMLVLALIGYLALPKVHLSHSKKTVAYLPTLMKVLHDRYLIRVLFANTILMTADSIISTYLVAFLLETYILGTGKVAPYLPFLAIGQLAGIAFGGQAADKFNKSKICAIGGAIAGLVSVAYMGLSPGVWISVILGTVYMGLQSLSRPAFYSLMVSLSSNLRGTVMGLQATSNHVGRALGALIGGLVLVLGGYGYLGFACLALCMLATAFFWQTARLVPEPEASS